MAMPSTSIKALEKEFEKKSYYLPLNLPEANNPFTEEELIKQWTAFAENLNDIKKLYLRNTMLDCLPKLLPDTEINVSVNHDKQEEEIKVNSQEIIQYLYKKLQNSHIRITTTIKEKETIKEENIYTNQEKYEYLRKKNPILEKLREGLNLNIE